MESRKSAESSWRPIMHPVDFPENASVADVDCMMVVIAVKSGAIKVITL